MTLQKFSIIICESVTTGRLAVPQLCHSGKPAACGTTGIQSTYSTSIYVCCDSPSSISGKPVRSSTFLTATPADSMALALPPVDTSSNPAAARPCRRRKHHEPKYLFQVSFLCMILCMNQVSNQVTTSRLLLFAWLTAETCTV